jgi:hypothetical protein
MALRLGEYVGHYLYYSQPWIWNNHSMASADQWISSIGTASATLLAAGAIALQHRDRRLVHAEAISAWATSREEEQGLRATLHVLNAGERPVFDVAVRAVVGKGQTTDAWYVGDLPPGEKEFLGMTDWGDHTYLYEPPRIELYFRDPTGRHWHHDRDGRITRLWRPRPGFRRFEVWQVQVNSLMLD